MADDGAVRLRLEVVSTTQYAEAERLARRNAGPAGREIVNELVVKPGLPPLPGP